MRRLALEAASSRRSPDALVHVPDAPDAPDTLVSGTSAKIRGSAVLMVSDSRQKRRCCCGAAVAEQPERDSSATAAPVAAIAPARSASPRINVTRAVQAVRGTRLRMAMLNGR